MVYFLSIFGALWGMRVVARSQDAVVVGIFAVVLFLWWALIRKNSSLSEWGDRMFIFFLRILLDVLEFLDHKKGVLRTDCGLEIYDETYSDV